VAERRGGNEMTGSWRRRRHRKRLAPRRSPQSASGRENDSCGGWGESQQVYRPERILQDRFPDCRCQHLDVGHVGDVGYAVIASVSKQAAGDTPTRKRKGVYWE